MKKITIRKGWFWGAGHIYKWTKVDPHLLPAAVGIDMEILKLHDEIKVKVGKDVFLLNCPQARSFISQWQSYKWIKNKCIGIVSRSIMTPVIK